MNWDSVQLEGKTFDLVDNQRVETFHFAKGGHVAATIGVKDGPVAGPVYAWAVKGQVLVISDSRPSDILEELRLLSRNGDMLIVKRKSGETVRYLLLRKQ